MAQTDFAIFSDLARQGNLIPVYREILGDLETPVSAYKKLRGAGCSYLLESVEGGEKWGRFSFLGLNPSLLFQVQDGRATIRRQGREEVCHLRPASIPLSTCAACWRTSGRWPLPDCPVFGGGWWVIWATTWCAISSGCRS